MMAYSKSLLFMFLCISLVMKVVFSSNQDTSMQLSRFRKQSPQNIQLNIADDLKVQSLLACSVFSTKGSWEGFAFCKSGPSSRCFRLTSDRASNTKNITHLTHCSFYIDDLTISPKASENAPSEIPVNITVDACPNGSCNTLRDCFDWSEQGGSGTGYVYIQPVAWSGSPFLVRCEDDRTVIQSRDNDNDCVTTDFNRTWLSYEEGFGNVTAGCFWLGNGKMMALSLGNRYKLQIAGAVNGKLEDLVDYGPFIVMKINEEDHYKLWYTSVHQNQNMGNTDGFGDPSGDEDEDHVSILQFYTYDNDSVFDCAAMHGAGWWYDARCCYGNLNKNSGPQWPVNGQLQTLTSSRMFLIKMM